MRTNLKLAIGVLATLLVGIVLGHELPDLRGQQTVVEIPNAFPPGVVVGGSTGLRFQAIDTRSRGLVMVDTTTGQSWSMSGAAWEALPVLPQVAR
jgi:hypothetical protein